MMGLILKHFQNLNKLDKICTVIVPVFNDFVRLELAIRSIFHQKIKLKWDIIIVDDGSDIKAYTTFCKKYQDNSSIRFFRNPVNIGPAAARNIGLAHAMGDFISFLDSDDCWPRDRSSDIFSVINAPEIDLVWGQTQYCVADNINYSWHKNGDVVFKNLLGSIVYKNCATLSSLRFDPTLRYGEDNEFWMQLVDRKTKIHKIESVVLHRHIHGDNVTFKQAFDSKKVTMELLKNRLKQQKK